MRQNKKIAQKKEMIQSSRSFFRPSPLHFSPSFSQEHTLKTSVSCEGIGVHSGKSVSLKIHPAPAGTGLWFQRSDLPEGENKIQGSWHSVTETTLCTKISNKKGVSVATVEHLMAALAACHIQNALIEISGPEVPIMDGSALPFYKMIQTAGIQPQSASQTYIKVLKPIRVGDEKRHALLQPASTFSISFEFDFQGRHQGAPQTFTFTPQSASFFKEIAPARTFGFVEDVEYLRQSGLALGASLENSVALSQGTILNKEGLRYTDEFVRHKVLDALGDLYLAGLPLLGAYQGVRAGHALNYQILKALFSDPEAFSYITFPSSEDLLDRLSLQDEERAYLSLFPKKGEFDSEDYRVRP